MVKITVEIDDDGRPRAPSDTSVEIKRVALAAAQSGIVPSNSLGVELRDVELWTKLYFAQITALRRLGADCPVVALPHDIVIPLDIRNTVTPTQLFSRSGLDGPELKREDIQRAQQAAYDAGLKVGTTRVERAAQAYMDQLTAFLTTRWEAAAGARKAQQDTSVLGLFNTYSGDVPGLNVTVQTRQPSLRVLASPSCWFQGSAAFGETMSPVVGRLVPGDYLFGAEGTDRAKLPDRIKIFEDCVHRIPPTTVINMVEA